jgi:hypothetical protein
VKTWLQVSENLVSSLCFHHIQLYRYVQGDRFRHEKNKRKRSTYRGGLIDDGKVNSIKFEYGSDGEDK